MNLQNVGSKRIGILDLPMRFSRYGNITVYLSYYTVYMYGVQYIQCYIPTVCNRCLSGSDFG